MRPLDRQTTKAARALVEWTAADLATGTTTNFDGGSPTRSFQIYYDASGSFQLLTVHTDLLNL